jgi:hypothetical protein
MHARMDFPETNTAYEQRQILSGLGRIRSRFEGITAARELVA